MAKIAADLEHALARKAVNGASGGLTRRALGGSIGWSVDDVICTHGPRDRSFEERHTHVRIIMVAAGSFQCRAKEGRELLTPGSLLLGNMDQCFECGHQHGAGDRCVAFSYAPDYFERLAADAGARPDFRRLSLPPLRDFAPLVARACSGLTECQDRSADCSWEELSIKLAARISQIESDVPFRPRAIPESSAARVTAAIRAIEQKPGDPHTLSDLARIARLSPYHFLRTFESLTGLTPHRYLLRARLREAAVRLAAEPGKIVDIALDCGFGDVSNFNRAFRREFGVRPGAYRSDRPPF